MKGKLKPLSKKSLEKINLRTGIIVGLIGQRVDIELQAN